MQIYCILISALLSVVRVYASTTADSVYFHIKADTMREIRAGQVVELTYALVNAQFDSVSPPVFNSSIEVIEGPKSHEGSSYAIINGVGRKSRESGFSYIVQFRQSGEVELPSASVKVSNRTYTTPECRVTVHPAVVDMNKLKCSLKVGRMAGGYAKYCATLTCNACPDQNPPLLSINGKIFRPTRKSFSISNGKEEYVYEYFFNDDSYEVSCEELTFGGKPYSVKPKKGKLAGADFLIAIVVAGALFELAWWLACRRRYREDKDALLAEFVLGKKALPLTVSWAYTHYGISHTLLLFSVLFLATTIQTVCSCLSFSGSALRLCRLLICHIATSGASWISKAYRPRWTSRRFTTGYIIWRQLMTGMLITTVRTASWRIPIPPSGI
ncbi:BatD family protein [Xylanibacter rodentium]|nr:BatD family protein [Xylanibacter rodentium]